MPGEATARAYAPDYGPGLWRSFASVREGALRRARTLGHREVNEAHVARELLETQEVRALATALGNDLEELELVVEGTADETPDLKWYSLAIRRPTPRLRALYERAFIHAISAELDAVSPGLLLVAMLTQQPESVLANRLSVYGWEPLPCRLFFAHRRIEDAPLPSGSGMAHLVALNDPFSTMELVVEVFEGIVGHDRETALSLMRQIHVEGRARVTMLPFADARRMAEEIRREARSRGYPLDVTIEPRDS